MDIENKNSELENENDYTITQEAKDELKDAVEEAMSKLRMQSMLLGAQAICQTILDKITTFEKTPGGKSNNDHKRLIKDIKNFCEVGLSRKVNNDGSTMPIEGTVQN